MGLQAVGHSVLALSSGKWMDRREDYSLQVGMDPANFIEEIVS